MKRTILGGLAMLALAAFGCGGPEETQTPEEYAADVQEIQRKALQGLWIRTLEAVQAAHTD